MIFYVVSQKLFDDKEYAYGEPVNFETGDFQKCPKCGSPISSREWLPPHKVKLSKPSYGDFVHGNFDAFLVSEHFKQKYDVSGLRGIIEFVKVDVVKVSRMRPTSPQPPVYYNAVVKIGETRIDEERSEFVRQGDIECDYCMSGGHLLSYKGVVVEQESWDGLDIFIPVNLPGTLITTQNFYDFVKQNRFTNINLVPSEEYRASWVE